MNSCNKCPDVRIEDWPKNRTALRCFNDHATPPGRVIDVHSRASLRDVVPPMICPRREGRRHGEES